MTRLKVHVLFEHGLELRPQTSTYVRWFQPLRHVRNAETIALSSGTSYATADVLIVERVWKHGVSLDQARQVVLQARRDDACLIYSTDDNLLDLQLVGSAAGLPTEAAMVVRYFAREAAGVIVSTDPLKKRLSRLNDRIIVVPNAIDETLPFPDIPAIERSRVRRNPFAKRPLLIGYMGSLTHDADVMMILSALRETLRRHSGRVKLQLVGGVARASVRDAFAGLPVATWDTRGHSEYPAFVRWMGEKVRWDFAIAPLEDNPFTRCKSDLKFLDYSMFGIPGIYSRVAPYEGTVEHLKTGYLVENTPKAWVDAIERLIADRALRERMARDARAYVVAERTLAHRAADWSDAIATIVAMSRP